MFEKRVVIIVFLYLVAVVGQIVACFPPGHARLRYATKPLLMPLLALCLVFGSEKVPMLICAGLLCGFFGDLFMLGKKHTSSFVIGTVFFAAGHILYSLYFIGHTAPDAPLWMLPVYSVAPVLFLKRLREHAPKMLFIGCCAYFTVLSWMSFTAFRLAVAAGTFSCWLICLSSVVFYVSDALLVTDKFVKKLKLRNLLVMSTYIAAQTGIAAGVYLMQNGGIR